MDLTQFGFQDGGRNPIGPFLLIGTLPSLEDALGWRALVIEHLGSTSVPGLPAKPIIDIDLIVADPNDEA
ncbi:hypothetical protein CVS28_14370 [Arthrobacter glacialis]|nr:hypothetical protein CVS28_14370 [Arthrobacter glacialis]